MVALWIALGLVAVCGLCLFCLGSRRFCPALWQGLLEVDYAHRGLHQNGTDHPENSMPAFRAAVEKGYGIELDVQLTKDGQMVVFHDDDLLRGCGVAGRVDAFTYAELQEMSLFGSEARIPLFAEVLRLIDGRVPLIVELKMSPANNYPVCQKAWELLAGYSGPYCVESFSPLALRWFRRRGATVPLGQLSGSLTPSAKGLATKLSRFLVQTLLTNCLSRPDFIAFDHEYQGFAGFNICRKLFGTVAVAWTIRSEAQYRRAAKRFRLQIFEGFLP